MAWLTRIIEDKNEKLPDLLACLKMLDFPCIILDKVEIPEQGATYPGCADRTAGVAETIWKSIKSPGLKNYLNALSNCVGETLNPDDLLPGWPANEYFKYAYPVCDENGKHLLIEHKFLYIIFHQKEDNISVLELCQTGPNYGSAGGPSLVAVEIIAMLHYTPQLKLNLWGISEKEAT